MADRTNTVAVVLWSVSTNDDSRNARRQWTLVGGLSILGAVGVAWGVARSDTILIGLWVGYLLLAALFAARVYR